MAMRCANWFSRMSSVEKYALLAAFVCLSGHLALAVFHLFPPIDFAYEQGFALAMFQLLEALVNLPTIWAQIKQSIFFTNSQSAQNDKKDRKIGQLKTLLVHAKDALNSKEQQLLNLQNHIQSITEKCEDEEARATVLSKNFGDLQKKWASAEIRLHKAKQTIQELEAKNFELESEIEELLHKKEVEEEEEDAEEEDADNNNNSPPTTIVDENLNVIPHQAATTEHEYKLEEEEEDHMGILQREIDIERAILATMRDDDVSLGHLEMRHKTDSGTFSFSCDSPGYHSSDKEDQVKDNAPFEDDMGFTLFKSALSRSKSESSQPKSFAKIAAKPPAAFNYISNLRMILPSMTKNSTSPGERSPIEAKKRYTSAQLENGSKSNTEDGNEEKKKGNKLYKTQICLYWKAFVSGKSSKKCRHGMNCSFAHGENDLMKLDPYYYKTELCEFWNADEPCPYSDGCNFAHGQDELRPVGIKGLKNASKPPSFYNNRQKVRKPRIKTQTCQPLQSFAKPVDPCVTVI